MRVVFMGTPEFAVPILSAVAAEHDVVAAYTRPDAASGRGTALRPSPVKEAARGLGIAVHQPVNLRSADEHARLRGLAPEIVVVAAYGLILPPEVLAVPPHGCVNVHASLLPRWRGAAPIQRAILAGDRETGVAIMLMEEGLDTGPYCEIARTTIGTKTAEDLSAELAELGAECLMRALPRLSEGTCVWTPQDPSAVTYADKIDKAELVLSPDLTVETALRRVRAASTQAPARLTLSDRCATVLEARPFTQQLEKGSVACHKQALVVGFADGSILLERVRPEGKAEMRGCDWARGARFDDASTWDRPS